MKLPTLAALIKQVATTTTTTALLWADQVHGGQAADTDQDGNHGRMHQAEAEVIAAAYYKQEEAARVSDRLHAAYKAACEARRQVAQAAADQLGRGDWYGVEGLTRRAEGHGHWDAAAAAFAAAAPESVVAGIAQAIQAERVAEGLYRQADKDQRLAYAALADAVEAPVLRVATWLSGSLEAACANAVHKQVEARPTKDGKRPSAHGLLVCVGGTWSYHVRRTTAPIAVLGRGTDARYPGQVVRRATMSSILRHGCLPSVIVPAITI